MKTPRIANSAAREYVRRRAPFKGSHMYAEECRVGESILYVVYSYGEHFPMYVAETVRNPSTEQEEVHWYANQEKFSRSTTRHQTQANPYGQDCIPMDTADMRILARGGLMALVKEGVRV